MDYEKIDWSKDFGKFLKYLESLSEEQFKDFSKQTTPGEFNIIGVRLPVLHGIANSIFKSKKYQEFLDTPDENIFEVRILKGYVIGNIKDVEEYKKQFEKFIPLINNWAVCDTFLASSKVIKKDLPYFYDVAVNLLKIDDEFSNRIAFVILLDYFVIDEYIDKVFSLIKDFKSDAYYANMGLSWLISEIFIKYPKETKKFLKKVSYDIKIRRYIARKIRDSFRVSKANKEWAKKYAGYL